MLLPNLFGAQTKAYTVGLLDELNKEEDLIVLKVVDPASQGIIETAQIAEAAFQGDSVVSLLEGHESLQASSTSFSRHLMVKGHDVDYNPIDPTTAFRPGDTKAECLTTVSINDTIEFRWYYRSNSSMVWISCYNWSTPTLFPGEYREYHYAGWLNIAGYWPGLNYPRAYKVDVYLDGGFSFSEFFEVTNGGLNSPRLCGDISEGNKEPIDMKSSFIIGVDFEVYHYLRFDKIAYFNEDYGQCHNFTTVWVQPNGSTYRTYSGSFPDYKDEVKGGSLDWSYWEIGYSLNDFITINSSTPVGNWQVEVYLDTYYSNDTWSQYGPIANTPFIVENETVSDWTFMVYLDGDNNLEEAAIDIFLKMANVTSSSNVKAVVQMDRVSGYDSRFGDWKGGKRFNVTEVATPDSSSAVQDLGEINMGHPDTLRDFVNWTVNNYPAKYYFLVLWDHGIGCMGCCFDFTDGQDSLTLPELTQALDGLPIILDVIFIDACSMNMMEVAYQIQDQANILIGPEGLGYAPAPYDQYLSKLTGNSSLSPHSFAVEVVTSYIEWCNSIANIQNATMAATDLTRIQRLIAAVDDYAVKLKEDDELYSHSGWGEEITLARNLAEGYLGPYSDESGYYVDLYNLAELTFEHLSDEELRGAAQQVMTALESSIIIFEGKGLLNSHGLAIFFPDEMAKYQDYENQYDETAFAKEILWDEFLKHHLLHQNQYYITINSAHGEPTLSQWVDENTNLLVVVTSPTEISPNQSRWRCIGYRLDDGDIQGGTSHSFENIQSSHKIEFYWIQQFWLKVDTSESGSTVEGTGWYDADTSATISATTPYQPESNRRFVFSIWNSTGDNEASLTDPSASLTTVVMNNYYRVQANWQEQYQLTVDSAYGTSTGQGWYDVDAQAIFGVDSPVDHGNGTRRVFIQWTSDSNETNTVATIIMDSPHIVTALWKTQCYFTVSLDPHGIISISGMGWYDHGALATTGSAELSIIGEGVRYVFETWVLNNFNVSENPIEVTMNSPYTAIARYKTIYSTSIPSPSLSSSEVEKGETVTISGYITPAIEGVIVTLTYLKPDGSTLNRTVVSSSSGTFSDTYAPDAAGTWQVTASWQGDVTHDGASSSFVSFTVPAGVWWEPLFSSGMIQIILGLVGATLSVALAGLVWVKTSKRTRKLEKRQLRPRARTVGEKKKYKLVYKDLLKEYPKIQRREFRVGIAQIGLSQKGDILSEFYEEKASGLFGIRKNKVETVRLKVKDMIERANAEKVNILLFPELTIDLNYGQLLEDVSNLAKAYEMYIIPGSYHDLETSRNVSVVIGPEGILWKQEKHIPAIIHHKGKKIKESIDVGKLPRKIIISNTEFGRIAIAICRDFLDMDLRVELKNCEPPVDLVFNPAFTPVTADFKAVHFDARRSIYAYSFFANVAEFGDSLIYTPEKERVERRISPREESLIYKDIDLFKLRSERKKWENVQKKERRFIQSTR